MSDNGKEKTIAVLGPDGAYLSHCTRKRASTLIANGRADKVDANTVLLKETKQERKKKMCAIIEKARRICYICEEKIEEYEPATIDHVIPKSRDKYADTYENMRCCCDRCNSDKGNMMPNEYIRFILKNRKAHSYLSDSRIIDLKEYFKDYQRKWEFERIQKENQAKNYL